MTSSASSSRVPAVRLKARGGLLVALALAACTTTPRVPTPSPAASRKPAASPAVATSAKPSGTPMSPGRLAAPSLVGKVKLLLDAGGAVVSNNGSAIISNNSGAIVAETGGGLMTENGAGLVTENGAGLMTENGAGLVANRRLLGTGGPVEVYLAGAPIGVFDAAGAAVLDAQAQPLQATTDAHGVYRFASDLPSRNVVLRVKLGTSGLLHGGELAAMLPKGDGPRLETPIDTASTLGAAYVLGSYVQGAQATYDKLPAAEAARLHDDLQGAVAKLAAAPSYEAAALTGQVEDLRKQAPAVDSRLKEIQALLLGQAHGGDGRAATTVALADPTGLALMKDGRLIVGEALFGRLREVLADGTIGTYADILRGRVKADFPALHAIAAAPDGSLVLTADHRVYRVSAAGEVSTLAGGATGVAGAVNVAGTSTTLEPRAVTVAPDGTVYIGETRTGPKDTAAPRLLSLGGDGVLHQIAVDDGWAVGDRVAGVLVAKDGTLYVDLAKGPNQMIAYRLKPGSKAERLAGTGTAFDIYGGLALGADGTLYETQKGRVEAIAPDGKRKVVAGKGGPAATATLGQPGALALRPDGTLLLADAQRQVVHALGPDGSWKVIAGTTSAAQGGTGAADLALSAPAAAVFDAQGRLLVGPGSGRELDRIDGGALTTLYGLDAAPPFGALAFPAGLAFHGQDLVVLDTGNLRILSITPDGQGTQLVHGNGKAPELQPPVKLKAGQTKPAENFPVWGQALALAPDGTPYWSCVQTGQVLRLKNGQVELVAGVKRGEETPSFTQVFGAEQTLGGAATAGSLIDPLGLAFDQKGDLYVADAGANAIRKITGLDTATPTIVPAYGETLASMAARHASGQQEQDQDGRAATASMYSPAGLAFDNHDPAHPNLYVSEIGTASLPLLFNFTGTKLEGLAEALPTRYARVRKIAPDGTLTTLAGPGGAYFNDPSSPDGLLMPLALAIAPDGRLAICDTASNRVAILPASR